MNIETYANLMIFFYIGLFLLLTLTSVVMIWNRIRKKTIKFWWIAPCSIFYSISAFFSTSTAFIAYDDPADPNYRIYKGWGLHNFILNDIKMLIIWLFIGVLLYLVFGRKECKRSIKIGCAAAMIFLMLLFVAVTLVSVTKLS